MHALLPPVCGCLCTRGMGSEEDGWPWPCLLRLSAFACEGLALYGRTPAAASTCSIRHSNYCCLGGLTVRRCSRLGLHRLHRHTWLLHLYDNIVINDHCLRLLTVRRCLRLGLHRLHRHQLRHARPRPGALRPVPHQLHYRRWVCDGFKVGAWVSTQGVCALALT